MKRSRIDALFFASVLIFNLGCEKTDNDGQEINENRIITNFRLLGEPVANPTNSSLCLNAESAERTLSSLRRISDRFYYMDFTTDLQFEELIKGGYTDYQSYNDAMENKRQCLLW